MDWSILEEMNIPAEITNLANERIEAKNKDYARADEIRKEVESAGYNIIDGKDGPILEKR